MDKKKLTRIMIVVVACLWAYNIYRVFDNFSAEEEMQESYSVNTSSFSPIMFRKDSFELELPDVDPFLKENNFKRKTTTNTNSTTNNTVSSNKVKLPKEEKVPIVWPKIKYYGFVMNHDDKTSLCLININGTNHKVKRGQKVKNLVIENASIDSIQIRMGKDVRSFRKG